MRTKNRPLKAGLAALGLFWTSANLADAQEAAPLPIPPAPRPAAATTAPTNVPTFAVLLLSNSRVVQGEVSLDKTGENYLLHLKGGAVPMPKKQVVKQFGSMQELYQYKVASTAPRDVDELMKLALWCLEFKMNTEAKLHLKQILAINPKDIRAERMVMNIDASAERVANARDPEIKTTSVDVVEKMPRELNPAALARAKGQIGKAVGQPVVFDLPPAVARLRATEFTRYVHPVLQASCASCHNQNYEGEFQLIQPNSKREWTPEVVRANLDATLKLVNRNEPIKSPLITFATSPHGTAEKAPFFGPNDAKYRTLSTWLLNLKSADAGVNKASYVPSGSPMMAQGVPQRGGFGADRQGAARTPNLPLGNSGVEAAIPNTFGVPQPKISVENMSGEFVAPTVPNGTRFDPPFVLGANGTPPNQVPIPPRKPRPPVSTAIVNANPDAVPELPADLPTGNAGGLPALPMPQGQAVAGLPPGTPVPPPDDVIPPTNRPKKKKVLDTKLLEQVLKKN